MLMVRILFSIPLWLAFQLLNIPLVILGWVLIPIAAACGAYVKTDDNLEKPADGPIYHFTWKFMFLWDNFEDGIACKNYWKAPNLFLQIIYWSAMRNPTNNLRIVPYLSLKISPERVGFVGSFGNFEPDDWATEIHLVPSWKAEIEKYDTKIPQWFFAWHGIYSNFFWHFYLFGKLRRFWIGWKIYPTDIYGVTGYRKNSAGFALQWKVI